MKIKSLLTLLLALVTLTATAQIGGVKGRVVSRMGRTAVSGVTITMTPGGATATSDAEGNFAFDLVEAGVYQLAFECADFEPLSIQVRVGQMVHDMRTVILVPEAQQELLDDALSEVRHIIHDRFDRNILKDCRFCVSGINNIGQICFVITELVDFVVA